MFNKKCKRCNREISRNFDFCPYCGTNLGKERNSKDYGFLGQNDFLGGEEMGLDNNLPLNLNKLFSSLLNQIDGQMKDFDQDLAKKEKKSSGISISISTSTNNEPKIKVSGFGPEFKEIQEKEVELKNNMSHEKAKEVSKLPREEAKTNVRRLSNKIIYEINLPGVKNLTDILINKLENSFEIKAFSKNKVYVKLIPLKLPLLHYTLEEEKLILEFKAK